MWTVASHPKSLVEAECMWDLSDPIDWAGLTSYTQWTRFFSSDAGGKLLADQHLVTPYNRQESAMKNTSDPLFVLVLELLSRVRSKWLDDSCIIQYMHYLFKDNFLWSNLIVLLLFDLVSLIPFSSHSDDIYAYLHTFEVNTSVKLSCTKNSETFGGWFFFSPLHKERMKTANGY